MDNNTNHRTTRRYRAPAGLAAFASFIGLILWATPDHAAYGVVERCPIVRVDADHATVPAYDHSYWGGRWIDAQGEVVGWSAAEDGAWYTTPGCAGLTLDEVLYPGTSRGIHRF